jgi:predicted transcriptional regulator
MSTPGAPISRRKTVDQVDPTNSLTFHAEQSGLSVVAALLSTHTVGAPVTAANGTYLGFINEIDVIKMLEMGRDLKTLQAQDIMRTDRLVITPSTTIFDAVKIMGRYQVVNLPVERNGVVLYSVSRHDLLRALVGGDLGKLSADEDFD